MAPREVRQGVTLKEAVKAFESSRQDVKPQTRLVWTQAFDSLKAYFGGDCPMSQITEAEAEDFEQRLIGDGYARATVRKRVAVSKMLWKWALKRGYAKANPFAELKSATVATRRRYFVTRAEAAKVLDACPSVQWRLIFALGRYAGLRIPSELTRLTWADVDWERRRLRIRSPKTEAHDGHDQRVMPIFPELMPYLQAAFDEAQEGVVEVIDLREVRETTSAYLRKLMRQIIERAGLKPWPRLFHNLRATRQTELSQLYPAHAICEWMGNSVQVAADHYLSVTEAMTNRAAGIDPEAVQNPVQHAPADGCAAAQGETESLVFTGACSDVHTCADDQVAPPGFEPGTKRL